MKSAHHFCSNPEHRQTEWTTDRHHWSHNLRLGKGNKYCYIQHISPWTHCRVLPYGKLNGMIPEQFPIYSESLLMTAATVSKTVAWQQTKLQSSLQIYTRDRRITSEGNKTQTRGQSNLTKSASQGAHSPIRGHPRGSKVVPLNSWGRVSY